MTQIDFYTNAGDKLQTACRLLLKGYGLRRKMMVCCPDAEVAQRLDRMLWLSPPIGFVPHCTATDSLAAHTPIVLDYSDQEPLHDQVLLNLKSEWPPYFGRFERLIEIVTLDEEDKRSARERFKFYRDRGYEIRTHDLSTLAQARG